MEYLLDNVKQMSYNSVEVMNMISIRMGEFAENLLKEAAELEGISVSQYVRNALEEKLEDYYDYKQAKEVIERMEQGNERLYSIEEVFGDLL